LGSSLFNDPDWVADKKVAAIWRRALENTVSSSGFFVANSKRTYNIDVDVIEVNASSSGDATVKAVYSVTDNLRAATILSVEIVSEGHASILSSGPTKVAKEMGSAITDSLEKFLVAMKKNGAT